MYATVNGTRLAYSDRGQRHSEALLLLHGFPLNRHIWDAQLDTLSERVRVIAPDLRGAGDSEVPAQACHMDQYADDVAGLLDHLGIERAVIGGLSMGGYVAFAFWRRYAGRVRALVLVDTRADADTPEGKTNRDAVMARVQREGAEPFAREQMRKLLAPSSQENTRLAGRVLAMMASTSVPGILATVPALRDRPDSSATLAEITKPVLVLVGEQDQASPPEVGRAMAEALPDARLLVIPRAGHFSPIEQPRAVNRALRAFLANLPA